MATRSISAQTKTMTDRIRSAVREIVPTATVILYGSRARGDAAPDSDWDILVLVEGPVDNELEDAIIRRLYYLELETDAILNTIVYSAEVWDTPLRRAMPFHENVTREGITL